MDSRASKAESIASPTAESASSVESHSISRLGLRDYKAIESGILRALKDNTDVQPQHFNQRHVEYLIQTGLDYLTRAIAQRDDGQELVLRAMHEDLTSVRLEFERDQLQRSVQDGELELERQAMEARVAAERARDESRLAGVGSGLSERQVARLRVAEKALAAKEAEISEARLKIKLNDRIHTKIKEARSKAGGALNFEQRIAVHREAFLLSFIDGYVRLRCASKGFYEVFSDAKQAQELEQDFPVLEEATEIGYMDRLLNWGRRATSLLEKLLRRDVMYTLVISKSKYEANHPARQTGSNLTFEPVLTAEHFQSLRNLRVVAVRVAVPPQSFAATDLNNYRSHFSKRSAQVELPPQRDQDGLDAAPVRVPLGDVGRIEDESEATEVPSLINAKPLGTWSVRIANKSSHWILDAEDVGPSDIFLQITVRATA